MIERPLNGGEQLGLTRSVVHAQHEVVTGRVRKFRRIPQATMYRVCIRGEDVGSLGRNVSPRRRGRAADKSFI